MAIKTLYSVLGLDPTATYDDIENAFTRLKLQYPKAKLDAEEDARIRFLAVQQAYQTLHDPDTRAAYDQRISRVGIRTVTAAPGRGGDGDGSGWMSTRNIAVAGVILILISGMWWYNARERTRIEAETVQRLLRMAEEEKQRKAELEAQQEARRQASFEASQQQQLENRERQFIREGQQTARQADAEVRSAQNQAEAQRRRERAEQDNRIRQDQYARQQTEREAQARLQNEKNQLRQICMQKYNRPDC